MAIFNYIDNLFISLPSGYRSAVALAVLVLVFFSLWRLLKGYGIFLLLLIILIPGVWPALKTIGKDILFLFAYLVYRL